MKIYGKLLPLALVAASLTPFVARAQNGTISPYSRFGYGLLSDQANAAQRQMGSTGYASRSGREVNFMNPASYAAIDSLTFLFDMAADTKWLTTSEGDLRGKNFTGSLDYVTLQVPITRWGGGAIGLIPYSEVGYSFGDEIVNGTNAREGTGGLNQLFLGLSARPLPGLTVGANIGYLFGTLRNTTYVYTDGGSAAQFERVMEVRDYSLRFGIQYGFKVDADNEVTLGAVFAPGKGLRGHIYGTKYDTGTDTEPDTIGFRSLKGGYNVPALYGGGVAYKWRNRLTVEADFTYQPWKNAKYAPLEGFDRGEGTFSNRWRASLGASWQPAPRGSYLQRITYRMGGSYCNDYVRAGGDNSLRDYTLTCGVGLPAPSAKSTINVGFEYRHRQGSPMALVKENYFTLTLGINFNELWFWRNKLR